jgi:hypothetical protein
MFSVICPNKALVLNLIWRAVPFNGKNYSIFKVFIENVFICELMLERLNILPAHLCCFGAKHAFLTHALYRILVLAFQQRAESGEGPADPFEYKPLERKLKNNCSWYV